MSRNFISTPPITNHFQFTDAEFLTYETEYQTNKIYMLKRWLISIHNFGLIKDRHFKRAMKLLKKKAAEMGISFYPE